MEKTLDIVSLGEILIDFVPDGADEFGDEKFICKAGGAPLNVLATCAKFGLKTAFIGKVGDDIFGRKLIKTLTDNGIDADGVCVDEAHNTTLAFVKLSENGERDFSFYRNHGADIFIDKSEIAVEKIAAAKIFHFGSLSFTDEPMRSATELALRTAEENGCVITYDPNYRPMLWKSVAEATAAMKKNLKYADIVKISREELELVTGKNDLTSAMDDILSYGAEIVIVTDGANDVFYTMGNGIKRLPAVKVKATDTTGAGDIFFGTFLTGFIRGGAKLDCLDEDMMCAYVKKAIEKSAESVTKKGAIASVPDNY